jgi:REP element-mobilizing transposase RayT
MLKLVGPSKNKVSRFDDNSTKEIKEKFLLELLKSDKIKYERALAAQKLTRDPDGIYVQLEYHIVWNVSQRKSVFIPAGDFIDFVNGIFLKCSDMVRGFAYLLYLAPDHVHVYVESNGELSIEEIVQGMKRLSNKTIMDAFPLLGDKLGGNAEIWDEAYFVETIGGCK